MRSGGAAHAQGTRGQRQHEGGHGSYNPTSAFTVVEADEHINVKTVRTAPGLWLLACGSSGVELTKADPASP